MCGRFLLKSPIDELQELFAFEQRLNLPPRFNVAPSQEVVIVRRSAGSSGRELTQARWRLVPAWAEDTNIGYKMINARSETVHQLPSYRDAYRKRRCLIPADGFYEWRTCPSQDKRSPKQPFLIRRRDQKPFAFAGLHESWQSKAGGQRIESCTIVTTNANRKLAPIHHRMPVILADQDAAVWLDPKEDPKDLMRPSPEDLLETVMISDRVNKPAEDDPGLMEPIDTPIAPAQGSLF